MGERLQTTNPRVLTAGPDDERVPLIQNVTIQPQRRRYGGHSLRRHCTIVLSTTLLFLLFLFLLPYEWTPGHRYHEDGIPPKWPWTNVTDTSSNSITFEELKRILLESPDPVKAEEWSK